MEFFRIRRSIPFMRHALVFNIISLVVFVMAIFFLATKGLHFSIEFTGGTVIEVSYPQTADADGIRTTLDKIGLKDVSVQTFGSSHDILVRLPLKAAQGQSQNVAMQKQTELVFSALTQSASGEAPECAAVHQSYRDLIATDIQSRSADKLQQYERASHDVAGKCVELKRVEFVGGQVGKELATDGGEALLFVCIGIVIYLVFGYSVNESVVVFDRVRENFRKMRRAAVSDVMDASITGTISRTIITHGCTQMMVLSIFFFGGPSLHFFALALTIGICFGIYSSVLVACPLAMYLGASREDFVKPEKKTVDPVIP